MNSKEIGQKLRTLRGDKTIAEFSKEIGIKPSTIGMYEQGERIPRDAIKIKYAKHFNMTVGEIFFGENCHTMWHKQEGRKKWKIGNHHITPKCPVD